MPLWLVCAKRCLLGTTSLSTCLPGHSRIIYKEREKKKGKIESSMITGKGMAKRSLKVKFKGEEREIKGSKKCKTNNENPYNILKS